MQNADISDGEDSQELLDYGNDQNDFVESNPVSTPPPAENTIRSEDEGESANEQEEQTMSVQALNRGATIFYKQSGEETEMTQGDDILQPVTEEHDF